MIARVVQIETWCGRRFAFGGQINGLGTRVYIWEVNNMQLLMPHRLNSSDVVMYCILCTTKIAVL